MVVLSSLLSHTAANPPTGERKQTQFPECHRMEVNELVFGVFGFATSQIARYGPLLTYFHSEAFWDCGR